jgi:hypothetical protein
MTRRKGERTARFNERDFPHIVEVALPDGGFGNTLHDIEAFHSERGIESRRGRRQRRDDREFVRWCFKSPAHADAFVERFGGERIWPITTQKPG